MFWRRCYEKLVYFSCLVGFFFKAFFWLLIPICHPCTLSKQLLSSCLKFLPKLVSVWITPACTDEKRAPHIRLCRIVGGWTLPLCFFFFFSVENKSLWEAKKSWLSVTACKQELRRGVIVQGATEVKLRHFQQFDEQVQNSVRRPDAVRPSSCWRLFFATHNGRHLNKQTNK